MNAVIERTFDLGPNEVQVLLALIAAAVTIVSVIWRQSSKST